MIDNREKELAPPGTFYNGWAEHGKLRCKYAALKAEHERLQEAHRRALRRTRQAEAQVAAVKPLVPLLKQLQISLPLDHPSIERIYQLIRFAPQAERAIEDWNAANGWTYDEPDS